MCWEQQRRRSKLEKVRYILSVTERERDGDGEENIKPYKRWKGGRVDGQK